MTECVEWQGAFYANGYGRQHSHGRNTTAHRATMERFLGRKLNRSEIVCHSCDNPACVNLEHLWVGTHSDNMRDMVAKGRNYRLRNDQHRERLSAGVRRAVESGRLPIRRGEQSRQAKLTEAAVLAIHGSSDYQTVLAQRYGVSQSLISHVLLGKSWPHLAPLTKGQRP